MIKINPQWIIVVETLLRFLIYGVILFGTWLTVSSIIKPIKRKKFNVKGNKREKGKIEKHIEILIATVLNNKSNIAVTSFYVVSAILGILTFLLLYTAKMNFLKIYQVNLSKSTILLGCLFSMSIPYVILRAKLHTIRIESSYEGVAAITEIINQYKISNLNMKEAIEKASSRLKKQLYTQKALFRMATELSTYKTSEELKHIIDEFIFSIDTQWAVMLGNNIFLAIDEEDDVRESLDDILVDLKKLNILNEKNKQMNNEAFLIVKFVAPFSYLVTLYLLFNNFGFSWKKFVDYQLLYPMGLKFFILCILTIVSNYVVYILVRKPKNDF